MKKILVAFFIISTLAVGGIVAAKIYMDKQIEAKENEPYVPPADMTYITPEVISAQEIKSAVMKKLKVKEDPNIYTMKYQKAADKVVKSYKNKEDAKYTADAPLLIMNPYGTNTTGLYIYFKNDERVNTRYTVKIKDSDIPDFTAALYTNASSMPLSEQEGQVIGLVPGETNYLILYVYDKNDALVKKVGFKIEVPDFGTVKEKQLLREMSRNDNQLTEGLFCIFGYDRRNEAEPRHLLFYDKYGVIRAEVPVNGNVSDVNMGFYGGKMLYPCGVRKFALVNRFGKVEKTYNLGKDYSIHHDFFLQESTDRVFVLADDLTTDTKEDVILCLDLYTGQTTKLLDMKKLLPDIYKKAKNFNVQTVSDGAVGASGAAVSGAAAKTVKTVKKVTGAQSNASTEDKLDWLHLNSVCMINETDMILSSRELSSIIRVNNVFEKPVIDYIIADEKIYKGTRYADLLLTKDGSFTSQFGQHSVLYERTNDMEDGQYYLYLFNNNYGESKTRPDLDWSGYEDIGLPGRPATNSYYYKYLVDDKADTYKLVFQVSLSYSPLVSNVQHYDGNIITSAGSYGTFAEYNADGKPVGRFVTNIKNFNYRVKKYDMEGYWFSDLWNGTN